MVTANDVVKFFAISAEKPSEMTNMKANKLAYYAQAWALARLNHPLFTEDIEAWEHGPVIPSVYHKYQEYGKGPIPIPQDTGFLNKFSEEECQLLMDVAREYGCLSAWKLRTDSHSQGEPWRQVYDPAVKHTVISKDLIRECFEAKEAIPATAFDGVFSDIPVVDELPADWDDGVWEDLDARV